MNYSHHYHAGNSADVFKHVLLSVLIEHLKKKDKPFCYIDTHAGAGLYDLHSERSLKTGEAKSGILSILKSPPYPAEMTTYLKVIETLNPDQPFPNIRYYPGSPYLVSQWLRPQDQMIVNEGRFVDYSALKNLFHGMSNIACHNRDAYEFLPAVVPPQIKRGLILIDPAYEKAGEEELIMESLLRALEKFSHGIYALWYPIKDDFHRRFVKKLKNKIQQPCVNIEKTDSDIRSLSLGLLGSGVLVVNPPFGVRLPPISL